METHTHTNLTRMKLFKKSHPLNSADYVCSITYTPKIETNILERVVSLVVTLGCTDW